jgi:hypothetical protein
LEGERAEHVDRMRHGPALPTSERSMPSVPVLEFAEPLPTPTPRNLAKLAQELERSGALLAIRHDRRSGRLRLFRVPQQIPLDPGLVPRGRQAGSAESGPPKYFEEGTDRTARGSILVQGVRWSAHLDVPIQSAEAALLTIERLGQGPAVAPSEATIGIPVHEAEAVLRLLEGLFVQARRAGMLPELEPG